MKKQRIMLDNDFVISFLKDKYKIQKCIKKNSFGGVYVISNSLRKKVLLKILFNHKASDEIIKRFQQEALIHSKLKHKNIVKIIEYGSKEKISFILFEYFENKNLREYLRENEISEKKKYELTFQLLDGLNYLHKNNVVHRDLKPENILVNSNSELKIADFGLSLLLKRNSEIFETQNKSIVGTPGYMSPEQIQGKRVTYQSDLFSLGSVIFEIFTSRNLFISNDFNKTINNIINFSTSTLENYENKLPFLILGILKKLLVTDLSRRAKDLNEIISILKSESEIIKRKKELLFANKLKYMIFFAVFLIIAFTYFFTSLQGPKKIRNKQKKQSEIKNIIQPKREPLKQKERRDILLNVPKKNDKIKKTISKRGGASPIKYKYLLIDTYPWSKVFLNDSSLGITPLEQKIKIKYGKYIFSFAHPGLPLVRKTVIINDFFSGKFIVNLHSEFGYLNCKVFPWGIVFVDGVKIGETPLEECLALLPGKHVIKVMNPSFKEYLKKIEITLKDTITVNVKLINN